MKKICIFFVSDEETQGLIITEKLIKGICICFYFLSFCFKVDKTLVLNESICNTELHE